MDLHSWLLSKQIDSDDFSERVGVSPEAVRLWRTGQRTPRPKQIAAIVKATNGQVSANDLLFRKGAA